MDTGKVLLGALAGIAAGAVLGILFAPDKGCHTRRKIAKTGEDFTDGLKEKFNDFMESVTEKFDEVKENVTEFADKAEAKKADLKKDMKAATDESFVR